MDNYTIKMNFQGQAFKPHLYQKMYRILKNTIDIITLACYYVYMMRHTGVSSRFVGFIL